jgi:hypothetical protein
MLVTSFSAYVYILYFDFIRERVVGRWVLKAKGVVRFGKAGMLLQQGGCCVVKEDVT